MKFLTTSTIALMIAAPMAFADNHNSSKGMDKTETSTNMSDPATLIRTRDITGGEIYTLTMDDDGMWDVEYVFDAIDTDWNQIGTIEDIVLSHSGQMIGLVAEVGGFLDIGDKHVMLSVDDLNLVALDDGTYTYVTRRSEEDLESMESVDEGFWN